MQSITDDASSPRSPGFQAVISYGHLPFQARKPCIVAIEGDPFTAPLDRKRRKPGIGDARPSRAGFDAQAPEDVPMPLAGLHNLAMRLPEKVFAEPERLLDRARRPFVVIRTTALNTIGDKPKRASPDTIAASHGRQTRCCGTSLRKA
jgi:hypothetical protein